LEHIARRAAAIIFIVVGAVLIMVSGSASITGAAVGSGLLITPMSFIIGFISFLGGLILESFSRNH